MLAESVRMDRAPCIGVDGCRGGWLAALDDPDEAGLPRLALFRTFSALLEAAPEDALIAVDMPLGLPATRIVGGRRCDRAARKLLGPRRSSVFSPPARDVLDATTFDEVRGRGLTIQAFNLLPRIRELDRAVDPELQGRVFEAHPELAFSALAGAPMAHPKRTQRGRQRRLAELSRVWGQGVAAHAHVAKHGFKRSLVAPDDVLDAWALVLTARRRARGDARRLPEGSDSDLDPRGLRMEIWW